MGGHKVDRQRVRALLDQGKGVSEVARATGSSKSSVRRIRDEMRGYRAEPPSGPGFAEPPAPVRVSPARQVREQVALRQAEVELLEAESRLAERRRILEVEEAERHARLMEAEEEELRLEEQDRERHVGLCQAAGVSPVAFPFERCRGNTELRELLRHKARLRRESELEDRRRQRQADAEKRRAAMEMQEWSENFTRQLERQRRDGERQRRRREPAGQFRRCPDCNARFLVQGGLGASCPECGAYVLG